VFAVHPLHVESVAWIAERKDVLSAVFWFLALYAYVWYCERPSAGRYMAVVAAFCLGLMSKPMLVTFPFTLLLLDVWPLRRVQWPKILWEKLPLVALSVIASAVTYSVQHQTGAVHLMPLDMRLENAIVSYLVYIGQTVWPTGLAVYYPYPLSIPVWKPIGSLAVLAVLSYFALRAWKSRPYIAVGWLWFLGTLVPVIGVIQAGTQAHADRYMYIPMVGLLIMVAWGAKDIAAKWPQSRTAMVGAGVLSCAVLAVVSWADTRYWRDSEAINLRAIEVTGQNDLAENNLGSYLNSVERYADAIPHFEAAMRMTPSIPNGRYNLASAHYNLGYTLSQDKKRTAEAIVEYQKALLLEPNHPDAHNNLAVALNERGDRAGAIAEFEAALRVKPDLASAHYNLASLLMLNGKYAEAIPHLQETLRYWPDFQDAQNKLKESTTRAPKH
jgi:protein O-mannosyl-transferase